MEFRILGPVEVVRDGQRLPLGGPRPRALLAILLLHRNRVVAADRLVELLWGDESPESATHSLQVHVSQLRKVLSGTVLESRTPGYVLHVADEELDASQFESRISAAARLRQSGKLEGAAAALEDALALWRGQPLADVASALYAVAEVARLNELRLRAIEERFDIALALGREANVIPEMEALVAENPLRERLCAQLMLALYRAGRQAEASDLYYRTRDRLVEDLGMEPGPPLQARLREILRQDQSLEKPPAIVSRPSPRPARRALCPVLIGRAAEWRQLEERVQQIGKAGGLILVGGEAGLGKTRLAEELHERAVESGLQIMWGGCSEAELTLPYLPIAEAIGNFLERVDTTSVRKRLGSMASELAHLFPQLGGDARPGDSGDPGQARLRLFESILALLRIAAEPRGLLLVVEDVHWADASTRELLDYLSRRIQLDKILVLLTYRHDEVRPGHPLATHLKAWDRSGIAGRVDLRPLAASDVGAMVGAIFNSPIISEEFRDLLHARSEGNPFVLEEMLKTALDRGDIYHTEGGWERKTLTDLQISPTLRDAILARVNRLDLEDAEIIRMAAVIGQSFSYASLVAASGLTDDKISSALRHSVEQQLLEPEDSNQFRFRHALTQEAIYLDLLAPERERRHALAAAALQSLPGTSAADIANHLVLAHRWNDAVPMLIQAAEEAEKRRGFHEAAELYNRALPHVEDPLLRARLKCRQAQAYYNAGSPALARPLMEESIPVLEQAGLTNDAATYRLTLGWCYLVAGRFDLAREQYEEAKRVLEPNGPSESLAQAYSFLANSYLNEENAVSNEMALVSANEAIRMAEAVGAQAPRLWGYMYRGGGLVNLGSTEEGLADVDRSWREALELGFGAIAATGLSNAISQRIYCFRANENAPLLELFRATGRIAIWYFMRKFHSDLVLGNIGTACEAAVEGLRLTETEPAGVLVRDFQSGLAAIECALGRPEKAQPLLKSLWEDHADNRSSDDGPSLLRALLDVGDLNRSVEYALEVLGDFEEAKGLLVWDVWLIDRAVETFAAANMLAEADQLRIKSRTAPPVTKPLLDRIEGRVALLRGDLGTANQFLSAAAQFFQDSAYREDEWRTRRVVADVKARQGDLSGAERELQSVLAGADEHGHVFEGTAARQQLADFEVASHSAKQH